MFLTKALLLCLFAVVAWFILQYCPAWIKLFLNVFNQFSRQRRVAILTVTLLSLGLRLAILPWLPIPIPGPHDESSHILLGDTLASGRLSNPTHPFWKHFETIYVLHQ